MASKKPTPKAPVSREDALRAGVLAALKTSRVPSLSPYHIKIDAGAEMVAKHHKIDFPTAEEIAATLAPLLASGEVVEVPVRGNPWFALKSRAPKAEKPAKKGKQPAKPGKAAVLAALAKAGRGGLTKPELAKALGCPEEVSNKLALSLLMGGTIGGFCIPGRGNGYYSKPAQAPIQEKVPDETEKDKRETLRTKILDAVDAAPKGRISLADLGRVTGTPVNGDDHEWDRMLEVLNVLESSGVLASKIVKMTTVISRASKGTRKALGAEDRAELAQSVDEAIASPAVAKKIRAAQMTSSTPSKNPGASPDKAPETSAKSASSTAPADKIHSLPLSALFVSPTNPRRHVGDLTDLAASIRSAGILQPLVVRQDLREPWSYEVVCGHRRAAAAEKAGLVEVPVVVRVMTDRQVIEAQLVENSQRVDVHPLEESDAIHALHKTHGVPVEEIAAQLGRPAKFVYQRLQLLKLAPGPRAALELGRITLGVALELTRLPEESQEEALPRILVGQGLAPKPLADCKPVLDKLSLRLVDAPFALDDASLPGGACTRCPKRTGAQAALFAEADGPDLCTDRRCYQDKVAVSEGRAPRTPPGSREIARDPAPIAPPSPAPQPDRPAIESEPAPIAQDRAAISPATARAEQYAKEEQLRREIEAHRQRHSALYKRLVGCPFDEEVFRAIALPMLSNRIGEIARSLDDLGLLVMIDEERGFADLAATGDRLRAAPVGTLWALLMGFLAQSMSYGPQPLVSLDDIERRLNVLDRATTPAPPVAAQVDEDDGPPVLGLSTEEAVAKVLLEHGPQTSRQVASLLGWDEEDRETQHKATQALAAIATCIDTRWYLPGQIPVRDRVLAALKATKVRRNARVLAITLGLPESEVATVLEQLLAERILTRFSGGEGAGSAYQLVETWKAKRGAPKARGKGKEGKKDKAPAPAVVDWRQLRQRVTAVLAKARGEALTLDHVVALVAPFTKEEVYYTLSLFDQASAVCFAQDLVTSSSAFDDDKISESIWRTVYDYALELVGEQKEPPTAAHLAVLIMLPEAMVAGILGELVEAGRLTTMQVEAEPPTYLIPAAKPAKPAKKGRRHSELKTAILEQIAAAEGGRELLAAIVRRQAWLGTEAQVTLAVDELVAAGELLSKAAITGGRWISQVGAGKAAAE